MLGGMSLEAQIKEARQTVEALTVDEAELTRLEAEQAASIEGMKASGSRDFAALATLEGKRAALSSMLSEQRAAISRAREELQSLEAAKERGEALDVLRGQVASLTARRKEVDALLSGLRDSLRSSLEQITAARVAWADELKPVQRAAARLYGLPELDSLSYGESGKQREWVEALEEVGPDAYAALTLHPAARHGAGLVRVYGGLSVQDWPLIEKAQRPVIGYLDRAVSLILAEVLAEADRAAPHPLAGGER